MLDIDPLTPGIGASLSGIDFSRPLPEGVHDEIYAALVEHLVIFVRGTDITPESHLEFARSFGQINEPHPLYPHVEGFPNVMLLENDASRPPDTNSWHTDLTFKTEQPFASILVAREVPKVGGDTLWSSCHSAYERLPEGLKQDLHGLQAVHDLGDFRNNFASSQDGKPASKRLDEGVAMMGHCVRPLIDTHPVTGKPFLNFNEAFVSQMVGMTTNDSNALKTFLANHMNKPEDQVRWRWQAGDLAMWDNRVTMHYALADYLPAYRCMNRVTVIKDRRVQLQSTGEGVAAE